MSANLSAEKHGKLSRQFAEILRLTGRGARPYGDVRRALQDIIEGHLVNADDIIICNVTVDYDLSLKEMIEAGGYDMVKDEMTADNFPLCEGVQGKHRLEVALLPKGLSWSAIQVATSPGSCNSPIEDLLALGAQHPDLPRKYMITAGGTPWAYSEDTDFVPCLGGDKSTRGLMSLPEELPLANQMMMITRTRIPGRDVHRMRRYDPAI